MKIGIETLFDCLLEISANKFQMIKNSSRIELQEIKENEIVFLLYPTTDYQLLSYAVKISVEGGNLTCCNPYVNITKIGADEYEIQLLPFATNGNFFNKISKANIAGYQVSIYQGEKNYVSVDDGTDIFFKAFDGKILKYDFFEKNASACVKVITEQQQLLFVYNSEREDFFVCAGQQILLDENQIKVIEESNDLAKHAKEKNYIIQEKGQVEFQHQELLLTKEKPQKAMHVKIVPYAFFEAIKAKNFLLAKEYLTTSLAQTVSMDMLEEYFGEFDEIRPYNFQKDRGYFINIVSGLSSKIFRIKIENSLIDEIEQITPSQ